MTAAQTMVHPARRAAQRGLLSATALFAATFAGGCASEGLCSETATCAPVPSDARSEAETGDLQDAGDQDAAGGGDASDAAMVDDRANRSDGSDATDRNDPADGSQGGDRSNTADGSNADRAWSDVADTGAGAFDGRPDAPLCDLDAGRSPVDNPCIVSERYGVFVSPAGSDATGAGTRIAPFRTINRALQAAKAETMRVFACDNGAGYTDPITIDATLDGLAVHGGFECSGWTLATNTRTRVHPSIGPALTINGLVTGVQFEGFELQAADATMGASSIAVHVQSSLQVLFRNSRILAGKGGAGLSGVQGAVGSDGDPVGRDQRGRHASCVPPIVSQQGGVSAASACGSRGGNGGACDTVLGTGPGESGFPMVGVDPPNQANGGTNWVHDRNGHRGSDGIPGTVGVANSLSGSFSASGYALAAPGADGTDGHFAQGGGGGTAGEADPANWCIGASGGAGGTGGCGGIHGTGGGAGGVSVALLSWMSGITLDRCELVSSDGGPGGHGGNGGSGGKGSGGAEGGDGPLDPDAAIALGSAGDGGPGGNGGPGGGGAGGNGGPTYGIVYAGGRPSQIGGTTVARGSGGMKGWGGLIPDIALPDGGIADGGASEGGSDGSGPPDGGAVRAPDGIPGDAAYELAIP